MSRCTSVKAASPASKLGFVTERVHQLVREVAFWEFNIIFVRLFLILWKHDQFLRNLGRTKGDLLLFGSSGAGARISMLIGHSVCSRGVDTHWIRIDRSIGCAGTVTTTSGVKGASGSGGVGKQLAWVRKRAGRDKLDMVLVVLVMVGRVVGGSLLAMLLLAALEEWRPGIGSLVLLVCHN